MTKRVLITGAFSKIGAHISQHFQAQGWKVLRHFHTSNGDKNAIKADFSNENEVKNLIANTKLDLLINNASHFDNKVDMSYNTIRKHIDINFSAPVTLIEEFYKNNTGNVINITDYSISKTPANFKAYSYSRALLQEYCKEAAFRMADKVRINSIALSYVKKHSVQSKEHFEQCIKNTPLKKQVSLKEICNTIDFLLKATCMTGNVLYLDSGAHLNRPEEL